MVSFKIPWDSCVDKYTDPCNKAEHINQCAVRMGLAFELSGVDLSSFKGLRCWENHKKGMKRHILRAQELADWIALKPTLFGNVKKYQRKRYPKMDQHFFRSQRGIIFIEDGWGPTDHIDMWDGLKLKAGDASTYLKKGKAIWIWNLT